MKGGMIHKALCSGKGGGGSQTEEKYDRIAGLPTAFAFDIADGWRCELCEDNNPTDQPVKLTIRGDEWGGEYNWSYVYSKPTKFRYLKIFKGSELKLVSDAVGYSDRYAEWYAASLDNIGELKKIITTEYVYTSIHSVTGYNPNYLTLPDIRLNYVYTYTEDGVSKIFNSDQTIISSSTTFIYKNWDIYLDLNVYDEFVKAVRKFSDEFNNNNTT